MTQEKISDARMKANRENAKHSTGPRTAEGKEISKLNSLKHGLNSVTVVMRDESQEEYDALHAEFIAEHSPVGPTERAFVKQISDALWRLRRLESIETEMLNQLTNKPVERGNSYQFAGSSIQIAEHFLNPGKDQAAMTMIARYQATFNRQFHQALKALYTAQDRRKAAAEQAARRTAVHEITGSAKRSAADQRILELISTAPDLINRHINADSQIQAAKDLLDPATILEDETELKPAA